MTTDLTLLHVVAAIPGRVIIARQDATDPRRWYAPAVIRGVLGGEATGRLQDLPGMTGVRVYRSRKAAQAAMNSGEF